MMDGIFSHAVYRQMRELLCEPPKLTSNPLHAGLSIFGMPVRSSSAFPARFDCSECGKTGEGTDSTYCPKCRGAGETRIDGMVQNGRETILIRAELPKLFQPSFPRGLVAQPQLCRGLP